MQTKVHPEFVETLPRGYKWADHKQSWKIFQHDNEHIADFEFGMTGLWNPVLDEEFNLAYVVHVRLPEFLLNAKQQVLEGTIYDLIGTRRQGVWHAILDMHPSERMGASQQDMVQGTNQKTMMVKFGLNSFDAMKEFTDIVDNGEVLNPINNHPVKISCFLAKHTRQLHTAKAKAKPKVAIPQMIVHNVQVPNSSGCEIPARNIEFAHVPQWTPSSQVQMLEDEIHGSALATCKPQLKCLFTWESWDTTMSELLDEDDKERVHGTPMMQPGGGGHYILQGNLQACNVWMAALLMHHTFPTQQGWNIVEAKDNLSFGAHLEEDPSQLQAYMLYCNYKPGDFALTCEPVDLAIGLWSQGQNGSIEELRYDGQPRYDINGIYVQTVKYLVLIAFTVDATGLTLKPFGFGLGLKQHWQDVQPTNLKVMQSMWRQPLQKQTGFQFISAFQSRQQHFFCKTTSSFTCCVHHCYSI